MFIPVSDYTSDPEYFTNAARAWLVLLYIAAPKKNVELDFAHSSGPISFESIQTGYIRSIWDHTDPEIHARRL